MTFTALDSPWLRIVNTVVINPSWGIKVFDEYSHQCFAVENERL